MTGAQVGERVSTGIVYGIVEQRDPMTYMLWVRWENGAVGWIHEMYVEPSRVVR